eukprot:344807-Hanusia_phi.AAC.15
MKQASSKASRKYLVGRLEESLDPMGPSSRSGRGVVSSAYCQTSLSRREQLQHNNKADGVEESNKQ